jgi:transcriptional regulator with XRE-family HTH domain
MEFAVYTNPKKRNANDTLELRREAGRWLKNRRELCGLSQTKLAERVGADPYTIISQIETGRGRVPPDKYRVWAQALNMSPRVFALSLLPFYDPVTYEILFGQESIDERAQESTASA